jgi:hypothetical protein
VLLPTPTDHYNFKYTPRFTGKAGISRQWGAWFIWPRPRQWCKSAGPIRRPSVP